MSVRQMRWKIKWTKHRHHAKGLKAAESLAAAARVNFKVAHARQGAFLQRDVNLVGQ